ncbi:serine/threonine protein kinase [Tolypothrix sp. NIES-4075]|uniref:serine/threonine-protein kinase n=1 Tax=Tolypothrix sp. NIES-4075 TaxID=2005459 RepID=UPI000B5CA2F8|nr:serine/threonine-protein kinase [Tolypothrix sp. NIES-4075]GAX42598.1 serine/threonine protein kinase [Tolypothrix sp. NIES-4075]
MQMLLNDRYRIIQTVGSGGFGETFLAEDTQMPSGRRCVIKQLKPIINNPQVYQLVQERFQREAAILEDLGGNSHQIPRLYAYFQLNGQFYLVQEWIEGDTLTAKLRQSGLFSESAVREILVNLLPVLEYVHSKRIVHRDIKPDNIILRSSDNKPVLIDFGAVRETMATVVNSQGNVTSSIVIGTPGYMPSEQAAGRPVYSSDLYSLGLTAIYLLTNKQPQELETDSRSGEIVWHSFALNVSPTLAGVIDRAIAYHPRDRFSSAKEMLSALHSNFAIPSTIHVTQPPTVIAPSATPQNMISSTPATPTHQGNGQRGILLASLIAGGLIGASIIIGLALNKQPQQVVQPITESNPQTTTLPNSQEDAQPVKSQLKRTSERSTNNDETQENAGLIKSQISRTSEPLANNDKTQENEQPIKSQLPRPVYSQPIITPTPTSQTSSSTATQIDKPSPEQAVQNYFATLNQGEYQTSWKKLSPSFQSDKAIHPDGYLSYIDWWGGKVQNVDIEQLSLVEETTNTATVNSKLKYLLKSGKEVPESVRFSLIWDAESNNWLISGAK